MQVTSYVQPYGIQTVVEIPNINTEDVQYFESRNIDCSMEELPGGKAALYGKLPFWDSDLEDYPEAIVVADMNKETCEQAFSRLVVACEDLLK